MTIELPRAGRFFLTLDRGFFEGIDIASRLICRKRELSPNGCLIASVGSGQHCLVSRGRTPVGNVCGVCHIF